MKTIPSDLLANVTGGYDGFVFRCPPKPIPEEGGIVGPKGSPTPSFGDLVREGRGGISPLPLRNPPQPIPESGGIVGPKGSPTPF